MRTLVASHGVWAEMCHNQEVMVTTDGVQEVYDSILSIVV